jgi:hypothetical protein
MTYQHITIKHQRGPWTKLPRHSIWVHTRGYVVEKVGRNVWDAYLYGLPLALGETPDHRLAVWSSPRHRTCAAAMSICQMEIRRIDKRLRAACEVAA